MGCRANGIMHLAALCRAAGVTGRLPSAAERPIAAIFFILVHLIGVSVADLLML